jgi:hypothetical protein
MSRWKCKHNTALLCRQSGRNVRARYEGPGYTQVQDSRFSVVHYPSLGSFGMDMNSTTSLGSAKYRPNEDAIQYVIHTERF